MHSLKSLRRELPHRKNAQKNIQINTQNDTQFYDHFELQTWQLTLKLSVNA